MPWDVAGNIYEEDLLNPPPSPAARRASAVTRSSRAGTAGRTASAQAAVGRLSGTPRRSPRTVWPSSGAGLVAVEG